MRDGNHSVAELMSLGKQILGRRHVLPAVTATLTALQVEGTFVTGTHLVTVDQPIASKDGDLERALYGSFLPVPSKEAFPVENEGRYEAESMPGVVVAGGGGKIELYKGRGRMRLRVTNTGDRPIQVCWISLIVAEARVEENPAVSGAS